MLSREYGGAQKNEQGNIAHRLGFHEELAKERRAINVNVF
jgi:hypothetical protein